MKVRRITKLMTLTVIMMAMLVFTCEGSLASWPWGKKTETTETTQETTENSLSIQASTTLLPVIQVVVEKYKDLHPEMDITIKEGESSEKAIAALLDGSVDIAVSERKMNSEETEKAKTSGIEPFLTKMVLADIYTNGEPKEALKKIIDFLSTVKVTVEVPESTTDTEAPQEGGEETPTH